MQSLANRNVESQMSQKDNGFVLKYTEPKIYPITEHLQKLSMPKPQYHSRDFFLNKDFRGLFLADHQEAIGEKAF